MGIGGIAVRESGTALRIDAFLLDGDGELVTSGSATARIYELQSDGTLKSYDFDDDTFKTTALTTETLSLTHRQGNNGTTDTGYWSAMHSTLTAFTEGHIYLVQVTHSAAVPATQTVVFQYGGAEGDVDSDELHLCKAALVNKRVHTVATGVDVIKDDDGTTTLKTLTPSEASGVVTVTPS